MLMYENIDMERTGILLKEMFDNTRKRIFREDFLIIDK